MLLMVVFTGSGGRLDQPRGQGAPPRGRQQVRVVLLEYGSQPLGFGEEGQPLFREYIVRTAVKPRLGARFLFLAARLRQVAERTIGDQTDLVVVVEDHPAGT